MARSRSGRSDRCSAKGSQPLDENGAARDAAERVARRSYGKLVAFLAARTRDVAGAEDALSDAFAAALAEWPARGIPASPEAWLMTVARRKAIDAARRRKSGEGVADTMRMMAEELEEAAARAAEIPDERLRLMFVCAHPAIDANIRSPLILQTILGFDAAAVGSAFLVAPATMAQRLVRAKTKIRLAGIPFSVPGRAEMAERLEAVLDAIYAAFAEGWSDPAGIESRRRDLAGEAIWLGRLVTELLPDEPEALGLLALMLHADARRAARRSADGRYVPLADQDPTQWDGGLIEQAESALMRAASFAVVGRYQIEAAVQSAHAARRFSGYTDWPAILGLYDLLYARTASPVVALNRAVALGEAHSPNEGLAALDHAAEDARLADYQPYWAARAKLLAATGRIDEAGQSYERAIGLSSDPAVRLFLQERRASLAARH